MRSPITGSEKAKNIVGSRIREARTAAHPLLTQDQLAGRLAARDCALDRVAITKIEAGQRHVFDFEIPPLALALGVDVKWLLGLQESGGPSETSKK